ncbi:BadF/BadG/BcrA/BcrD ATPase family protein [Kordia sp.]|uniref:BadF/BadG/BcrA/BcrD ATPase family protein n=1 Tax=Kordia sp. TaxID=1965332 RepID=UPI003D6C23A8
MVLIADSGSTKCDWILYENKEKQPLRIRTEGLNPVILSKKELQKIITENSKLVAYKDKVTSVCFFGAGCGTKKNQDKVEDILNAFFKNATAIVREDIMAAVWATTNEPAVVCILGTGSNCCYFDGHTTHSKIPSLGYMVMDEGSGNYFGKKLLRGYFYKKMPEELRLSFEATFNLKEKKVIDKLYKSATPNKYLAEFAKFMFENKEYAYIKKLLAKGMAKFIENHILQYRDELKTVPLHFVGSIAYHGKDFINNELAKKGLLATSFVRRPMENLIHHLREDNFHVELH